MHVCCVSWGFLYFLGSSRPPFGNRKFRDSLSRHNPVAHPAKQALSMQESSPFVKSCKRILALVATTKGSLVL